MCHRDSDRVLSQDLGTIVDLVPPWRELADDTRKTLDEIDSKLVQPQPVSKEVSSSHSPQNQQLNIRQKDILDPKVKNRTYPRWFPAD